MVRAFATTARNLARAGFDGVEIPAFLFLPPGYQKGTKIPFVAYFHGGPEGQHRPGFDRTVQFLLSRGYGVIQPNVRGSTGYGRAFQMMDVPDARHCHAGESCHSPPPSGAASAAFSHNSPVSVRIV